MRLPSIPLALACVTCALTWSATSRAFTISSALTDGCHEQITESALRTVRATNATATRLAPDRNEQALIDDLPFDVPSDMNEIAAASLLVGIRDNDLKGRSPTEIDQLATVHGDPNGQEEHCLRAEADDEPAGTVSSLARCRAFILARAMSAVDALAADGTPDANVRDRLDVSLSLRGRVNVSLPAFWIRTGQAMHALQDSFAHTYRDGAGSEVTVALNWIDLVNKVEVESRDGPPHKTDLDKCNAGDPLRNRNRDLATTASVELLSAMLAQGASREARSAGVNAMLDRYLAYSPGCTAANAWCDAAENAYTNTSACGCTLVGGDGNDLHYLGLFALALVAAASRRARRPRITSGAAVLVCVTAAITSAPSVARAEDADKPAAPIPPRTKEEKVEAKKEHEHASPFVLSAAVAGSVVDPALAQSVGARYRLSDRFLVGLDAEVNEWFGLNQKRFELGATSIYATGIFRFPMRFEPINLRTTVHLGGSYENLDLYGVPRGSVGLFVGAFPMGLEWKLSGNVFLIVDPLGIAVPVPHLTGAPFAYPQFRSQVGVELAL
jgi:hypothetical protein